METFYPRAEVLRQHLAMLRRVGDRVASELAPRFVPRLRSGALSDSDFAREWQEAVDRILAEEVVETRRLLASFAVEGSA